MPTQIAPTPTVRGSEARKIYEEMQRMPTPASEKGAKMLAKKFEKMMK